MFYGVSIMILRKDMEVKMGLGEGKDFFRVALLRMAVLFPRSFSR